MSAVVLIAYFAYQFVNINLRVKQWSFYTIAIIAMPFIFQFTSKSRLDRAIGELSFPVYLSHILVYEYLAYRGSTSPAVTLLVTLIVSILLTKCLINPLERLRQKRVRVAHHEKPDILPSASPVVTVS
jgi:peptidoglycan/LPS O-acetylase OafA/YrhL